MYRASLFITSNQEIFTVDNLKFLEEDFEETGEDIYQLMVDNLFISDTIDIDSFPVNEVSPYDIFKSFCKHFPDAELFAVAGGDPEFDYTMYNLPEGITPYMKYKNYGGNVYSEGPLISDPENDEEEIYVDDLDEVDSFKMW